jgi:hypothetical protein
MSTGHGRDDGRVGLADLHPQRLTSGAPSAGIRYAVHASATLCVHRQLLGGAYSRVADVEPSPTASTTSLVVTNSTPMRDTFSRPGELLCETASHTAAEARITLFKQVRKERLAYPTGSLRHVRPPSKGVE